MIQTDDGKEFVNKNFTVSQNKNSNKRYNCYTSKRTVFATRFNRTTRDLFEKPVFEKRNANCIDETKAETDKNNKTKYSSSKLTTIEGYLKKRSVHRNLSDKRKK